MAQQKYSPKALTNYIKELAVEVVDMSPSGDPVSRARKLAEAFWLKAIGGKTERTSDKGEKIVIIEEPHAWAMQLIMERLDGKIPNAAPDDTGMKTRVAEKVSELSKKRANAMAHAALGKSGPPKIGPAKDKT